jgi:hypothetical protein
MKKIILITFTLLAVGMLYTINPLFAADRIKFYEMAESGMTFEFKMTPEEIAAEDRTNAKLAALKEARENKPAQRVKVFEMGDSGTGVSFPMTAAEIAAEDAESAWLAAIRKARSKGPKTHVVRHEIAESGDYIDFPAATPARIVTETMAEKKAFEDAFN